MPASELSGLSGWVADVVASLGWLGVGFLTLIENLFPPIPSEVVLPLAGYLASAGRLSLVMGFVGATVGSVLGAAILYEASAAMGWERFSSLMTKLPLLDDDDLDRSRAWMDRHDRSSVLVGRLIPGIRSLISVPAGAQHMDRRWFYGLTVVGTAAWNALLIGAGWLLGESWTNVERYSSWLDALLVTALVVAVARFVWHRRDRIGSGPDRERAHEPAG